jgi:hypothetical protein
MSPLASHIFKQVGSLEKWHHTHQQRNTTRHCSFSCPRALRGTHVGNKQAVAAVKANAEQRAADLRALVDDLRTQGITSVRAIAAELNERGILTPRRGAWHSTSAARLLLRLQA